MKTSQDRAPSRTAPVRSEQTGPRETSRAARRDTAPGALRSAGELERDATVAGMLIDELGGAASAIMDSNEPARSHEQPDRWPPSLEVWVEEGTPRITVEELHTLAELRVGELTLTMQLVGNARGETLMRAIFVQAGRRQLTEDVWLGIAGLEQADGISSFARRFRETVASLPASRRALLLEALDKARERVVTRHANILKSIYQRELHDAFEQQILVSASDDVT